jgi:uncharacterized protein (TIGR03437 family)
MKLSYVRLMLKASAGQQAALEKLLTEQQDRSSPNYHKWLMPEQYADRFGLSPHDIGKIRMWLESGGLAINYVARGRGWIAFSGTADQVAKTFHTEIHRYTVDGEMHFANATEPEIPAELEPVLLGFLGLNDFRPKKLATGSDASDSRRISLRPAFDNSNGSHALAPDDLATIYDIFPLYSNSIDGSGQRVVVTGQSNVRLADIASFRHGILPANVPEVLLVPGHQDPGFTEDESEADLDIEWVGAVARNATIIYAYSLDAFVSAQYAIDQNLAPVITNSFGDCETQQTQGDLSALQSVVRQGNSQGITLVTASGDAGAADCDGQQASPLAVSGLSVGWPANIPEVTAVGGTEFSEGSGVYWSSTNSATLASALSYIPEIAWNDSGPGGLAASGGGFSKFFPQPSWQTSLDLAAAGRVVPDVSLAASSNHDPYRIYTEGAESLVGGTSAGTPVFAGIVVLLNQYEHSNGQGNINPNLYRLARSTTNVFHDISTGSNIVQCKSSTPDCTTGSFGYSAGPGYDPVTGLGSVDAYKLLTEWNSGAPDSNIVPSCTPVIVFEQPQPDAQGYSWLFTLHLKESAGVSSTLTDFTVDGTSQASQIASFFGTSNIPANGSISAPLGYKTLTVPTTILFGFTGVDAGGRQWSQEISVAFNGRSLALVPTVRAVVNGASFAGGGIVPGEIATLFGNNLTSNTGINLTSGLPLVTKFLNVSVMVNGKAAPLFAVDNVNGQQQINFQIPREVATGPNANIAVTNNGTKSPTISVPVLAAQPGIINYAAAGGNFGVILHSNFQLADSAHPAVPGETVLIYCTGLGAVSSPPADGAAANGQLTVSAANVMIGSVKAKVSFSGLAPGFVGLYQVNAVVPSSLVNGDQPVVISMGATASNSALLPIR